MWVRYISFCIQSKNENDDKFVQSCNIDVYSVYSIVILVAQEEAPYDLKDQLHK